MKPVGLVERAIRNSSPCGGLVLDPFGGSGTTLIAAERTGRKTALLELDPRYCDVIVTRWQRDAGCVAALADKEQTFDELAAERLVEDIRAGGQTSLAAIADARRSRHAHAPVWPVAQVDGDEPARPARAAGGGMRQSRLMSLLEALANVVVGYAVAVLVQIVLFPRFGWRLALGRTSRSASPSPRFQS